MRELGGGQRLEKREEEENQIKEEGVSRGGSR